MAFSLVFVLGAVVVLAFVIGIIVGVAKHDCDE